METSSLRSSSNSLYLWLEWLFMFILVPVGLRIWWQPKLLLLALVVVTVVATAWLLRRSRFDFRPLWRGENVRGERKQLVRLLLRFAVNTVLIAGIVLLCYPDNLFEMPREQPRVWAMILVFYPLLSVYPQELIYRVFFFERYRRIFRDKFFTALASAVAFGLIHIVFQNPLAVVMTLVGGWFFAETYARTRSLRLVWLEHALYGMLVFTVGLGDFFYHARVGKQHLNERARPQTELVTDGRGNAASVDRL